MTFQKWTESAEMYVLQATRGTSVPEPSVSKSNDDNNRRVFEPRKLAGTLRSKLKIPRPPPAPSNKTAWFLHFYGVVPKGFLTFLGFLCNAEFSPCWALPEYIRTLIHLACLRVFVCDVMGYCLPT